MIHKQGLNKLLAIFFIIAVASCNGNNEAINNENNNDGVSVVIAEKEAYTPSFQFTGTVKPFREANLGTAIPGRVETLFFKEGDFVNKGELIAELSGEATAMARYEYETLKKDYQRVARLRERGSVTQQDYDHVNAKFKAAKAKYDFFKSNSEIRAPFPGIIVEYLVNEGETFTFSPGLEPGYSHSSGIARLMQMNPVKVNIDIGENLLPEIENIRKIAIETDVYTDKKFDGEIYFVRPVLSKLSRTATVEVSVNNPRNLLMPGMFARVNLGLKIDSLVFVPRHAIVERKNEKGFVWQVKSGYANKIPVNILQEQYGKMAVKGIMHGDSIIVTGLQRCEENEKVNIIEVK